jgi:tetratricopeptide (TPR) repeat protein
MEVFMKLKLYSLFFIGITMVAVSCKTASKLYEKGRYDEAVELAAKKLQKDPDDPKLFQVLQDAYRFAVEDHEANIRNHNSSNNELRSEWIYGEYADLQRLYESIRKSPDVFNRVRPTDYSTYVTQYREKAGEVRYDRGITLMSNNDKMSYRKAYQEFQLALNFIPGDIDIRQKMDESFSLAVTNIVVLGVEERNSYQWSSYNTRYRSFDDNIMRYLQSNNNNRFVKYYSEYEARNRNVRADQYVDVRFTSMNVGRANDEVSTRQVSKDVVVKETVYKPDSIIKEYAKVYATIRTTKRILRSEGLMQVVVRDQNNRRLWTETYSGQHFWTTDFATYTGDSRALSEADKELVNRTGGTPPREEDIIRIIMDELQSKVECGIKDYFYNY